MKVGEGSVYAYSTIKSIINSVDISNLLKWNDVHPDSVCYFVNGSYKCFRPDNVPAPSVWKGVMGSGKTGLLNSEDVEPYLEINRYNSQSPLTRNRQRLTTKRGGDGEDIWSEVSCV